MGVNKENSQPERRPEGKEGAGSHQEGKNPVQAGQSQRREHSEPEKNKSDSTNDHQKTVSGKKQHGPEDNVDQDAGATKAARDRTWMRVALPAPGRSPVTAATIAAEVEHQSK
jgi:hypothetical protein